MNFPWGNVFDYWKERHLAFLFLFSLVALPFALVFGCLFYSLFMVSGISDYLLPALPGIGVFALALIWRAHRLRKLRKKNRYRPAILSRDELSKARSKLVTNSTNGKT